MLTCSAKAFGAGPSRRQPHLVATMSGLRAQIVAVGAKGKRYEAFGESSDSMRSMKRIRPSLTSQIRLLGIVAT